MIALTVARVGVADDGWRTEAPITYVLDYGSRHLDHPEYVEAVRTAPPTLLHLGKDVVMSHNWGPIECLGGENQAGGKGDCIRRLTPDETRQRLDGLTAMVSELHDAGCTWVMPYICSMTIGGSHRTRAGFWDFYDHWYDYEGFELPERPALDPEDWMQRNPDGSMKSTYGIHPSTDDFYPPYEPNMRYAACVNNPGWRAWIDTVCRQVARVGYDGAFIDNGSTQQCYCEFCQAKYQRFLRDKYSPAEMRELFDVEGDERVPLTPKPARGEEPTVGWVETQRFWIESIHQHQLAMRRAGEEVGDHFLLFPNGGRPRYIKSATCDSDWVMFELSTGEYGTNPGLAEVPIVEDIHVKVYNHHAFEYKYVQSVRKRVRAMCLTRGGYPKSLPSLALNEQTAALGMAEAAAFGSGAGFLMRSRWDQFGPVMNHYREFFETHAEQYAGLVPHAQVGVAVFADQGIYGNSMHLASVKSLTEDLLRGHALFDYVIEDRFTAENLRKFEVVIVPLIQYASVEHMRALADYVAAGGVAVVIGGAPTRDLQTRPLDASGQADGEGKWVYLPEPPEEGLVAALSAATGTNLSVAAEDLTGAVRMNAFVRPEGNGEIMLHVLNYDTPLGVLGKPARDKTDVAVSVPLPEGKRATRVTAWSPDRDDAVDLPVSSTDGRATFTLPSLHIYEMARVTLE